MLAILLDVTRTARPLNQWAVSAKASTEYSDPAWAAHQATGKPDTHQGGDIQTAWASKEQDAGDEWLELSYPTPVIPTLVRIHETFNPGAVSRIETQDVRGRWHVVWEGKDPTRECPGWFEPKLKRCPPSRVVRITIDSKSIAGWNEIDAVELIGERIR